MRESVDDQWLKMVLSIIIISLVFFLTLTLNDYNIKNNHHQPLLQEQIINHAPEFVTVNVVIYKQLTENGDS